MKRTNESRKFERIRQRIQAEICFHGERHPGTVLDVSPSGLFVRMSPARVPPVGTEVSLHLKDTRFGDMTLLARVARTKTVRRELMAAVGGGVALKISSAPESYYALLAERMRVDATA
ncbi:MAG: PilZ domain-containing protein [Deltaproteobacteria bacterium]|nr:PilZ domain-containing protein [Deltaproteobacteria bacterium]